MSEDRFHTHDGAAVPDDYEPTDDEIARALSPARRPFFTVVLTEKPGFDRDAFLKAFQEEWDIEPDEPDEADEALFAGVVEDPDGEDGAAGPLTFSVDDFLCSVMPMPFPVPDGEAEESAEHNFLWPEAVETTKRHAANLVVAVMGPFSDVETGDADDAEDYGLAVAKARAKLLVKLTATAAKLPGALGVYTCGTVFEPQAYREGAEPMEEDEDLLPLRSLVWINLWMSEEGFCAGTDGLSAFGFKEIEVLDVPEEKADPDDVLNFVLMGALYVLEYGAVLEEGETIGFTEEDQHPVTVSPGESLDADTVKIEYGDGWEAPV